MTPANFNPSEEKIKIAIVAGEKSGDHLGGPLIQEIKKLYPQSIFVGLGGKKMQEQGLKSLFNMEEIAVMGIIEPLLNLRKLLKLRKKLKDYFLKEKPDLFIGIDSPDFNLPISRYLKNNLSIKTLQYVSPSIWAWRSGRIKKMELSIDAVLTLFPFEKEAYSNSSIVAHFIGHPLAYEIPLLDESNINEGIGDQEKLEKKIALLPGSRKSEVTLIGNVMVNAAILIKHKYPDVTFLMPLASEEHKQLITNNNLSEFIQFSYGNSKEILSQSDLAVITSGTATLEAVLYKTPCVVVYKTGWLSYKLIKPLLKIKNFSLPNLLAKKELLPELLQEQVTPQNIADELENIVNNKEINFHDEFRLIHESLRAGGSVKAAEVIKGLLN